MYLAEHVDRYAEALGAAEKQLLDLDGGYSALRSCPAMAASCRAVVTVRRPVGNVWPRAARTGVVSRARRTKRDHPGESLHQLNDHTG